MFASQERSICTDNVQSERTIRGLITFITNHSLLLLTVCMILGKHMQVIGGAEELTISKLEKKRAKKAEENVHS